MRRPAAAALLAAAALAAGGGVLAGCGSGDPVERIGGGGGVQPTLDTGPLAPLPATPTETQGAPATTPQAGTATVPATAAPDRATFTIDPSGQVGPSGAPVKSGIPVTLTLRNDDDRPHTLTVLIQNRPVRRLAPGASATVRLIPLAPGAYTMLLDGDGSAAVLLASPDGGP